MITLKHATPHHPHKNKSDQGMATDTHPPLTGRCMLASTIQLSNHHPTPHNPHTQEGNHEAGYYPKP